jgi:hypothetical protein
MTNQPLPARDTRIDVFRALALLTIFINHVPGTAYENFTHKNLGFSDSAEAFVLISGIAVGLAYGRKFQPGSRLIVTLKALRRAATLYVAHIMTTVATLAIFSCAALYFARPDLLKLINIQLIIEDTPEALVGIATLGHQIGYNNILSVYAAMFLAVPLFLFVGSISLWLMVGISGTLWLLAGLYQVAPKDFPGEGLWFLNPLSWQFLFVIGMAAMLHVKRGGRLMFNRWLAGAAFAYVLIAAAWVRIPLWGIDTSLGLPAVLTGFDKTFLSVPRLLHILSLAYLIAAIPALSNLARTKPDNPLAVLGKHSLPIFIAGTLLAMVAQVAKIVDPGGLLDDTVLIATGIALQFGFAYYLEWLSKFEKDLQRKPAQAKVELPSLPGALSPVPVPVGTTRRAYEKR